MTQVADADKLLRKGNIKLLIKDMHEYCTSHTTSHYVSVSVRSELLSLSGRRVGVRITSVDEDDVNGNIETDDVSSEQSLQNMFAILQTQMVTRQLSGVMPSDNVRGEDAIRLFTE